MSSPPLPSSSQSTFSTSSGRFNDGLRLSIPRGLRLQIATDLIMVLLFPALMISYRSASMKWEYTTVMFATTDWWRGGKLDGEKFNEHLKTLGEEEWELVSVFDTNETQGASRDV